MQQSASRTCTIGFRCPQKKCAVLPPHPVMKPHPHLLSVVLANPMSIARAATKAGAPYEREEPRDTVCQQPIQPPENPVTACTCVLVRLSRTAPSSNELCGIATEHNECQQPKNAQVAHKCDQHGDTKRTSGRGEARGRHGRRFLCPQIMFEVQKRQDLRCRAVPSIAAQPRHLTQRAPGSRHRGCVNPFWRALPVHRCDCDIVLVGVGWR